MSPYGEGRAKTTVVLDPPMLNPPNTDFVVGAGFGCADESPDEHAANATAANTTTAPMSARDRAALTRPQPFQARARAPAASEAAVLAGVASVAATAKG